MNIEILSVGSGISLQDGGRIGWRRFGVPLGGAMDKYGMCMANYLLGNRRDAPVVEIPFQGARLRLVDDMWIALAGADSCPELAAWTARLVKAGEVLEFSRNSEGIYSYLAVPGGVAAAKWFGSVSVDLRNGLGGPLSKGDQIGSEGSEPSVTVGGIARRILDSEQCRHYRSEEHFDLLPGPQFDSFSPKARQAFISSDWTVSARSDRTGFRLSGTPLETPASIMSEPVLPGSFQIPGNGLPIVTMVDGPTVGGYPKIAILRDADSDRLAQCAPGTRLRLKWTDY